LAQWPIVAGNVSPTLQTHWRALVHGACSPRVPAPSSRCVADRLIRSLATCWWRTYSQISILDPRVTTCLHTGQYEVQKCSWRSSFVREVLQLSHSLGNVIIAGDNYPPVLHRMSGTSMYEFAPVQSSFISIIIDVQIYAPSNLHHPVAKQQWTRAHAHASLTLPHLMGPLDTPNDQRTPNKTKSTS